MIRTSSTRALLLLGMLMGCSSPPSAERPAVDVLDECRWADGTIAIDGVADEAAWKAARAVGPFRRPGQGVEARTATSARLLWDREYLYFYAEMEDLDLYADIRERDGPIWTNDVFELFLKPAANKPGYYEFEVSPANAVLDLFLPQRDAGGYARFKTDHAFEMDTAVKLRGTLNRWGDRDQGWSVEGRIRWRSLLPTGGRPAGDEVWTYAFCRVDVSVGGEGTEYSTNAPLSRLDFHRYEDYRRLKFVGPRTTGRLPWDGSALAGSPEPPPPFRVRRAFPKLQVPCPMHAYAEPGTSNLLLLHQLSPWGGAGRVLRVRDDDDAATFETLHAPDALCYGLAFDPNYADNGFVYIGSNGPLSKTPRTTRVTRFTVDRRPPHAFVPGSELVILEWPSDGHNGGDLAFGPDGMLYVSSGDGTSDSDADAAGQDLTKLTAKILRIDVRGARAGRPYEVPADNPFVRRENCRPETWAYGLRNPWRISFDRESGRLWVGNNGQDHWEQVYLVEKGANYGWSVLEGTRPFYAERPRGSDPFSAPVVEHPHSEAWSLTGGQVYHGSAFPELRGMYVYGDWVSGKVWGLRHDGRRILEHRELADTSLKIAGFGVDSRGELLLADHGGGYYRLERAPAEAAEAPFPVRLSGTGVFASVRGHVPHPAAIPYSVNAPLWSDGAAKERFILLPGSDTRIGYATDRGWDFPDGTVLVKSFAWARGDTRRWIETRLLSKQAGKWRGYSYEWNDAQDDAVLVAREGADREFDAPRQKWRYPSRSECFACHSRASNFVLGLTEAQLNRDVAGENQLSRLERLGVLSVRWADHERDLMRREAGAAAKKDEEAPTRLQREPVTSHILPKSPERADRLVDPYDGTRDLTARARSYLHANCAQCHVLYGGGNALLELEYKTPLEGTRTLDVKPLHHAFGKADPRVIAPGDPERSVLLHRMSLRGPGQMPPLATSAVDEEALKLLRAWIVQLGTKGSR
jgi:uncharacterized repeat protein (TIGR03806 family)